MRQRERVTRPGLLFGGALFAAGLAGGPAIGGGVEVSYSLGIILGAPFGAPLVLLNPLEDGPFGEVSFDSAGLSAQVEATADRLAMTHDRAPSVTGWGYSLAGVDAAFTALEDCDALVTWDFGGWFMPGGETNLLRVRDETAGLVVLAANALFGPDEGAIELSLQAGHEYTFFASTQGTIGGGDSFVRIEFDPEALIGDQPGSVALEAGGDATLHVGQTGASPGAAYRWERNGVPLEDDGRVSGASTPTLTITGARYEDAGAYRCRVSDGARVEMSVEAVVGVFPCIGGDVNGDGAVNFSDLNALLVSFGLECDAE